MGSARDPDSRRATAVAGRRGLSRYGTLLGTSLPYDVAPAIPGCYCIVTGTIISLVSQAIRSAGPELVVGRSIVRRSIGC